MQGERLGGRVKLNWESRPRKDRVRKLALDPSTIYQKISLARFTYKADEVGWLFQALSPSRLHCAPACAWKGLQYMYIESIIASVSHRSIVAQQKRYDCLGGGTTRYNPSSETDEKPLPTPKTHGLQGA